MGYRFAKVFGPTDSVASVVAEGRKKTQIGSDYVIPNGPGGSPMRLHIHTLIIGKGNVVNAKECAGILEIIIEGVTGKYEYAYGNGTGGATNSGQNGPAERINCRIPITSGDTLQVYVNDAEIAKDVTVTALFWDGHKQVYSYASGGGAVDCTADTELSLAVMKLIKPGKIREIRFAGSVIADAEAGSAKLVVDIPGEGLPHEFAVGNGPGGATLGGAQWADVIKDLDIGITRGNIPVNTEITVKVTAAEALKSPTCSIQVA